MSDLDLLHAYSAALDEVYRLRRALAYEALVTRAHLGYKTFPKSRRRIADDQIARMEACALGRSEVAYAGTNAHSLRSAMEAVGGSNLLTRSSWEASLPSRRRGCSE